MSKPEIWPLARRAQRLEPSVIREILKITEQPGVISLAGGLPAAQSFPVQALREACQRVLTDAADDALQYAASEGYGPLREWVAAQLGTQGLQVQPAQVLITTGSQQGLDLVGKVLIDAGSRVAVESPTYLGALQAFAPYEPDFVAVDCDEQGPRPEALAAAAGARFLYLLPNFQNPSGRSIGAARRLQLVQAAQHAGLPLVEDNPYGDLWFDSPPRRRCAPRRTAASTWGRSPRCWHRACGWAIWWRRRRCIRSCCRPSKRPTCTPLASTSGWPTRSYATACWTPTCRRSRARYKAQRDAMRAAWTATCRPAAASTCRPAACSSGSNCPTRWTPRRCCRRRCAAAWPLSPAAPFYCRAPRHHTLRLSFVTVAPPLIEQGVAALGAVLRSALQGRSMKRRFDQLDVFTAQPLRGNPLAVVHDAQGLDDERMAAFARWTHLSETTFLLPPSDPAADYRVRIFTPAANCRSPAIPTLGSCHAWLAAGGRPRRPARWCSSAASAWCACARTARGWPSRRRPLRRQRRAGADAGAAVRRASGWSRRECAPAPTLDNGPRWLEPAAGQRRHRAGAAARPRAAEAPGQGRRHRAATRPAWTATSRCAPSPRRSASTKTRSPAA